MAHPITAPNGALTRLAGARNLLAQSIEQMDWLMRAGTTERQSCHDYTLVVEHGEAAGFGGREREKLRHIVKTLDDARVDADQLVRHIIDAADAAEQVTS